VTTLQELAGQLRAAADDASGSLAINTVRQMADIFLPILHACTPVLTGALRDSESVQSVSGDGVSATAIVAPDIIYADFRNDGGTIHVKRAQVLTNGTDFFGKQVTQAGSHYMEKADAAAQGPVQAAAQAAVDAIIAESGLA
jgi:hypothetical protein